MAPDFATRPGTLVPPSDIVAPPEAIQCTERLSLRPKRTPDYEVENRALTTLAQALADSPTTILQKLADVLLEVLRADSAGISLLTEDRKSFYWPAIAGAWQPHLGGGTPRDFGPCGDVLDRNAPLLFTHWERRYPYLLEAASEAKQSARSGRSRTTTVASSIPRTCASLRASRGLHRPRTKRSRFCIPSSPWKRSSTEHRSC